MVFELAGMNIQQMGGKWQGGWWKRGAGNRQQNQQQRGARDRVSQTKEAKAFEIGKVYPPGGVLAMIKCD
jgi:hypothetical protein